MPSATTQVTVKKTPTKQTPLSIDFAGIHPQNSHAGTHFHQIIAHTGSEIAGELRMPNQLTTMI